MTTKRTNIIQMSETKKTPAMTVTTMWEAVPFFQDKEISLEELEAIKELGLENEVKYINIRHLSQKTKKISIKERILKIFKRNGGLA